MTLSNLSPAERIVAHEQKITGNIQKIQANEGLIETQELAYEDLLAEKTVLDAEKPSWKERVTFDDSLKVEKEEKKQAVNDAREETIELKKDTYQLKEETHTEQEKLKVAHSDEQMLHQQNIDTLEDSKNRSEDRLKRLEDYDEQNPEKVAIQAENIEQEQAVLAKRENDLAEAKESAENAKSAAQTRDAKVADDIKEACPLKCKATQLAIKSNNGNRKYQMATELNGSVQTLHVISLSKAAVDKKLIEPPVSVISVAITGLCEKGKESQAAASADEKKLVRTNNNQYCPVLKIEQGPINIAMPGTSGSPLNFQAFCPDPPTTFFNWDYLFKNIFMPEKRESTMYTIESEGCDGSYSLVSQVAAYPKIKAEIGVAISYKPTKEITTLPGWEDNPEAVDVIANYNEGHRTVEYGNWVFAFDLKGSVDSINLSQQLEFLQPNDLVPKLRKALNLFLFIFDIIKICCGRNIGSNIFEDSYDVNGLLENNAPPENTQGQIAAANRSVSPTGSIDINYPKIAFAIAYENCEELGTNTLGHASAVTVKLDPLIGVLGKVDMLSALIKIGVNALIPGVGAAGIAFVEYIAPIIEGLLPENSEVTREDIENRKYYLEGGIALVLNVGANISAEGKWTHTNDALNLGNNPAVLPASPDTNPEVSAFSGMTGASLEMQLEGKVYVKGKAWAVTFEAGLMIAMGSAKDIGAAKLEYKLNITGENGVPKVEGAFEWNGLAILTASYKSFGVGSKDNDEQNDTEYSRRRRPVSSQDRDTTTQQNNSQKNYKNQWVLIEPGRTPKTPEPVPLNDYFNS